MMNFQTVFQVFAVFSAIVVGAADGFLYASGEINVVVLYENHVEETDTVICSTSHFYSLRKTEYSPALT